MKNKFLKEECIVFAIGTAGFLLLGFLMINNRLAGFDTFVQSAVFSLRQNWLSAFMVPFSYSGNWQAIVPLCLILLLYKRTRTSYGVPLTISALTAVLFYQVLKHIFSRARPDVSLHLLQQHGYSFPSGHSLTSFLVWGTFALLILYYARTNGAKLPLYKKEKEPVGFIKKKPVLCAIYGFSMLYIVLMGFSRVYVGVHWPSDILASWFLGMALLVGIKKVIWK
ncbi:MAG: phosphatase PAP2 family protein [Clostridia bacterium]|nr:phosphatase PAP2 family protein [Clostridia bacterium]